MKKFNGHRCERRNLTDIVLGTGPTGAKRAKPKANTRPKNYATAPEANQMSYGGKVPKMNPGGPVSSSATAPASLGLTGPQVAMFQYLISQGASPEVALGITSVTKKESEGKAEAVEQSYAGSSNSRIRGINSRFARVFGDMSDEELDKLKADPEAFFNLVYNDPENLGNTEVGDGYKYRGRGLVQLTGRKNYQDASQALFGDDRLVENPDLLLDPDVAGKAAGWFALTRGKGVGGYLDFDLGTQNLSDDQLQQVLDGTYATIASAGTLSNNQVRPDLLTQRYGQYSTGMPKMQAFVKSLPLTQIMQLPDQLAIDAERKQATDFLQRIDQNAALIDTRQDIYDAAGYMGNYATPDATMYNMSAPVNQLMTRQYGGPGNPPTSVSSDTLSNIAYLQAKGLIPTYNAPVKNDRLYNYSDSQLSINEQIQNNRASNAAIASLGQSVSNLGTYAINNPLDATQVALGGLAIGADAVPVVGNALSVGADAVNGAISAGRSGYYALTGDMGNSAFYGGLAALDAAATVPGGGNVAGASKIAALLNKAHHVGHAGSQAATGYKAGSMLTEGLSMEYGGVPKKYHNGGPYTPGAVESEMQGYMNIPYSIPPQAGFMQRMMTFPQYQMPDMQNLAPGEVPKALADYNLAQGKLSASSAALSTAGQMLSNTELANQRGGLGTATSALGGAASGLGAALPYAAAIPGIAPFAVVAGAMYGAWKKKDQEFKQDRVNQEAIADMQKLQLENTLDYSNYIKQAYDDKGQQVNSYFAKYGGPQKADYETEKSEVVIAGAYDKPIAIGQGKYKRISNNLYQANGPSHAYGGIPTKGATRPFVDSVGMQHDTPYVFSDTKDMKFDATDILKMIS